MTFFRELLKDLGGMVKDTINIFKLGFGLISTKTFLQEIGLAPKKEEKDEPTK